MRAKRFSFINQVLTDLRRNGGIEEPSALREGLDFSTRINSLPEDTVHYKYFRGFIDWIEDDMTVNSFVTLSYYKTQNYTSGGVYRDLFMAYVRSAMAYTREEFYAKYPKESYPLIAERFELVITYMKNTYGIDLQGIAKGPDSN